MDCNETEHCTLFLSRNQHNLRNKSDSQGYKSDVPIQKSIIAKLSLINGLCQIIVQSR